MAESSHNRARLERHGRKKTWHLLLVACLACNAEPRRDKSAALAPTPVAPAIDAAAAGSGYTSDIEKICDVVSRSGSTELSSNDRMYMVATWLDRNLETQQARDFVVKIQPLGNEDKATALETEARTVGLAGCALAVEWRTAP